MNKFEDSIKKYKDGVLLYLFVKPKASKVVFPSCYNSWRKRIEIEVCSEPKDNKANIEVIGIVADFFSKSTKDVSIVSGEKNKEKTLFIRNIVVDDIIKKLRKSFDGL
jgi:uncharacterized protein (TIGR00251 family)